MGSGFIITKATGAALRSPFISIPLFGFSSKGCWLRLTYFLHPNLLIPLTTTIITSGKMLSFKLLTVFRKPLYVYLKTHLKYKCRLKVKRTETHKHYNITSMAYKEEWRAKWESSYYCFIFYIIFYILYDYGKYLCNLCFLSIVLFSPYIMPWKLICICNN